MVYIKKLVMHGFKSFARRTEVNFEKGINVFIGPNGSGKSNLSDALCFVLGRLSVKSMRAAKSKNLIFMGSKDIKPAKEAYVEIVWDNSDKAFALPNEEVSIKRIVRHNGLSIYKINDETKTRLEIIEMLAQAGIDPYGFNIILQGDIHSIVRMHPEERRRIIEDVAGISIYETRKEKSLKELEKTEESIKEINAVLRERSAYLKNLEQERAQALRFKELESTIKKCKASILHKKISEKIKEIEAVESSINEKSSIQKKIKDKAENIQKDIDRLNEEISKITKRIQNTTGLEQETIHNQITNLKAELEGLKVRKENYENKASELERRIKEIESSIPNLEDEIANLQKESPEIAKKAEELKKKKEELNLIEAERKKLLSIQAELSSIKQLIKEKEKQISRTNAFAESLVSQLEEQGKSLSYSNDKECEKALSSLRKLLSELKSELQKTRENIIAGEKQISILESEKKNAEKIKYDIEKMDICPLCQSVITEEHKNHVFAFADEKISNTEKENLSIKNLLNELLHKEKELITKIQETEQKIISIDIELVKHRNLKEKNEQLKNLVNEEKELRKELAKLEQQMLSLEGKTQEISKIEEKRDAILLEIEEISSRTSEDLNTTLLYKQRELESMKNIIKRSTKDVEDLQKQKREIEEKINEKSLLLKEKEEQERELQLRFKKLFDEREKYQKEIQNNSLILSELQQEIRSTEEQINYLKIGKAKLDAEREALQMEMSEFSNLEILQGSLNALQEKLAKAQEDINRIGSINLRALEVYDDVKKEYDAVAAKVEVLLKEKQDILKIIEEIDARKKRAFMKSFNSINEIFSSNFSKLSSKGIAFLEIENKENIFEGGVNIVIKLAKGKYFDVTSLSGGEQTLIALSLLFAIQEHKPYPFYLFDEIDAALDKRNSERLAALLSQSIKSGQYIIITHNDALILNADLLYGVSMHEGVSKVLSLKVKESGQNVPAQTEEKKEISVEEPKQNLIQEQSVREDKGIDPLVGDIK